MKSGPRPSLGRRVLTPLLGRKRYQPLFKILYEVSLAGLNYGEGANPASSGEAYVMRYVKQKTASQRPPIRIFDVGANIGQYTTVLLDTFGSRAAIHSFEPSPATFKRLAETVGSATNVKLENFGFGESETILTLYTPGEGSKLASLYPRQVSHQGIEMSARETVEIRTIDAYCAEEKIERIHFLKLDVEGHELKVLTGASSMIERGAIDFIQFEFGGAHVDSRTYFKDFFNLLHGRYRIYRVLSDGLWPITSYRETYEVFKRSTNYLAERI